MQHVYITLDDDTVLTASPRMPDFVRFERKFETPVATLEDEQKLEWMLYLAYAALKRQGDLPEDAQDFEDFLDRIVNLDTDADEEDEDPTGSDEAA